MLMKKLPLRSRHRLAIAATQCGFTLIEFLVALVAGLVITGGVTTVYIAIATTSITTLGQMKLEEQVNTLMIMMTNDIRRAGYWGVQTPADFAEPVRNPFNQIDESALEVHVANVPVAPNNAVGGACIVYSYDLNDDGALDDGDIAGFRLINSVVQMRIAGDTAANDRHDSCQDADDNWVNVSDPDIVSIDALNFSLGDSECLNSREPDGVDNDGDNGVDDPGEVDCYGIAPVAGSGDITIETRQVTITLSGRLLGDPDSVMSLAQDVRVRNDLVRIW